MLTDRAGIERVAAIAARAGVMKLTHGPTQAELHSLMRFSARAGRARSETAWTWSCSSPRPVAARFAAVATQPRVLSAAAPLRVAEMVARDSEEGPLRSAPALCLLYADALEAETFLRGGACFEEIALDVTEAGLAMALHSAPIEVGLSHPGPLPPSVPADWHAGIAEVRRELLAAFGAAPQAVPIAFFRLGSPTREPERKSLRRTTAGAAAGDRALPGDDPAQPAVAQPRGAGRAARRRGSWSRAAAASAGRRSCRWSGWGWSASSCASRVTTSSTTSTARPPTWATSAGTRPRCRRTGPGRSTRRSKCCVEPDGVTEDNVDWLVGTTDLVIDGVDVTEPAGIAAKRALHEEAWRQRRLVISGLDLGGTQVVYAFDYRDRPHPAAERAPGRRCRATSARWSSSPAW